MSGRSCLYSRFYHALTFQWNLCIEFLSQRWFTLRLSFSVILSLGVANIQRIKQALTLKEMIDVTPAGVALLDPVFEH